MKKYMKFMQQQQLPDLHFEDKQMPHTQVDSKNNSLRYVHGVDDGEPSAARTTQPLLSNTVVAYFEAVIISANSHSSIGVGLIHKDCALKKHPGQSKMSFGYISRGDVLMNRRKLKMKDSYKSGSVVGIGIIYPKNQIFITLNGKKMGSFELTYDPIWTKFYPCVSLRSHGDCVKLKFKDFSFDFQGALSEEQNQCIAQIEKQDTSDIDTYDLVGDYLKFHGFDQTFEKLQQIHPTAKRGCFLEHPFLEGKIQLREEKSEMVDESEQQAIEGGNQEIDEEDEEITSNRKNSTRQRIMSDYWGDMVPVEFQKKRPSYDQQMLLLQSRRKSSVISNLDPLEGDQEGVGKEEIIYNKKTTQFLLKERLSILKLTREQRIEEAYLLMKKQLPQILELYPYLHAYFWMHIYLNILKNQGPLSAINFTRQHSNEFVRCKEETYPIFSTCDQRAQFVTFTHMMGLVTKKPETQNIFIHQFHGFSNYLNELILKSFGLYSESRLELLIDHIKCIALKNEQHRINGPLFNCSM